MNSRRFGSEGGTLGYDGTEPFRLGFKVQTPAQVGNLRYVNVFMPVLKKPMMADQGSFRGKSGAGVPIACPGASPPQVAALF